LQLGPVDRDAGRAHDYLAGGQGSERLLREDDLSAGGQERLKDGIGGSLVERGDRDPGTG
jgi:hypothetical protein